MEYKLKEVGCPHCGHRRLTLKENLHPKNFWKQLFAWLRCRNENMLLTFYYKARSKKMQKKMPVSFSKQWECPDCGSKYHDLDELSEKIQKYEKLAAGVMVTWVIYNISVILVWYLAFHQKGFVAAMIILLISFLIALFIHSGLRLTALQRKAELGKLKHEIMSCEQHKEK